MKFILLLFLFPAVCFSQWISLHSPQFNEFAISGNTLFGVEENTGVHISTNDGISWTLTSLNTSGLIKIAAEGSNIFAGTANIQNNRGIYRSTNSGLNWIYILPVTEFFPVTAIAIAGSNIFAATGRTIYHSTNNGANWTQTPVDFYVYAFAINGNNIFAGVESIGVFRSTNNGASWAPTSFNNRDVFSIKISGAYIFAGSETGIYLSTNNGLNWSQTGLDIRRYVTSLAINSVNIFAGTETGVYLSKDNGSTWVQKNHELSGFILDGPLLTISNNFIFASNKNSSSWKRLLSEIINIKQLSQTIPEGYELHQNYPNPFNPSTKINFSIPQKSFVTLKIYNLQGKEISVLLNQELTSGPYEYTFNGESLSSGTYFYRLESENFSETKSMVLVK